MKNLLAFALWILVFEEFLLVVYTDTDANGKGVTLIKVIREISKGVTPMMVTKEISKELTMMKESSRETTPVKMDDIGGSSCPGQFQCLGGQCISLSLACDGNTDCPDDSDEAGCHSDDTEFAWWAINILSLLVFAIMVIIAFVIYLVVKRVKASKQ